MIIQNLSRLNNKLRNELKCYETFYDIFRSLLLLPKLLCIIFAKGVPNIRAIKQVIKTSILIACPIVGWKHNFINAKYLSIGHTF